MNKNYENLKVAFQGESMANRRYLFYARMAREKGLNEVAAVFEKTAQAVREVQEEVGVRPTALAGTLPPFSPRNVPWLKVVPHVFTQWEGDLQPNPAEVAEVRWVSRQDLKETEWMGAPAYAVGSWVVWGLTYRILSQIVDCGLL